MNNKQLAQARDQLKKQIVDLDHQILQLQTYYIQDTRQYGNLLKGFDNYIASKTARNQPTNKKQKVQNFERIFSLSSIKSKTSQIYQENFIGQTKIQSSQIVPKRNRNRPTGGVLNKNGKNLIDRQEAGQEQDQNSISADNGYSMEQSANKQGQKRKKITKGNGKGISKKM